LDEETLEMMNSPRCGNKDKVGHSEDAKRRKRYALQGYCCLYFKNLVSYIIATINCLLIVLTHYNSLNLKYNAIIGISTERFDSNSFIYL
jgi:hypothetical protein